MARKTNDFDNVTPILVSAEGLQKLTGAGKHTAEKIAEAAGARVRIGKRVLYNTHKIEQYINGITELNEV